MKGFLVFPVLLIILIGTPAFADFQKGLDAANRGDFATALKEWKPLAEQGNVEAQLNLGSMYANGKGVAQDYKAAIKWFKLAAGQGYADAQYNLGIMYDNGRGVAQDYKIAVKWFKLAAGQGYAPAQYNLGIMYDNGRGVTQDYKAAVKWFKLAAEQGIAPAQFNMGVLYYNGQGVIQDYTLAHMWLNIAASQGGEEAAKNRDKVGKEMTPSQIAEAQKLARECVAKNYKDCLIPIVAFGNEVFMESTCGDESACLIMDANFGVLTKSSILKEEPREQGYTEYYIKIIGNPMGEVPAEHTLRVNVFTDGMICTDLGSVAVYGFSEKMNPIIKTNLGKFEVSDPYLTVGCKGCAKLYKKTDNKLVQSTLTPGWDMSQVGYQDAKVTYSENGEIYLWNQNRCITLTENSIFKLVDPKRCIEPEVVGHYNQSAFGIEPAPAEWILDIKGSRYFAFVSRGACT